MKFKTERLSSVFRNKWQEETSSFIYLSLLISVCVCVFGFGGRGFSVQSYLSQKLLCRTQRPSCLRLPSTGIKVITPDLFVLSDDIVMYCPFREARISSYFNACIHESVFFGEAVMIRF